MSETRDKELMEKQTALTAEIERLLPDFARSCRGSEDVVIIHQDSFAADFTRAGCRRPPSRRSKATGD
jgi:hypothetical protein